jgi:SAM-dependent methyltransferase
MAILVARSRTNLFDGSPKRLLHVAPEPMLESVFRSAGGVDYLSGDLDDPRAMIRLDITDLDADDSSFDCFFCSHVLEHVPDDMRAMRELCRVLRPGGWGMIQIPITAAHTIEDPSVVSPSERLRLYGQSDHVRRYGPDVIDRLHDAGFVVEKIDAASIVDRELYGIPDWEAVFLCHRRRTTHA